MAVEHINPKGLLPPHGYTHVVRVTSGTTLYVAGQSAFDAHGELVGVGDHYAQSAQAFRNVLTALAAADAGWQHVVKATYYLVDVRPDTLAAFQRAMRDILGPDAASSAAATFVGVAALAFDEMLVEIDVTAVVD